jgi:hypothetical protein
MPWISEAPESFAGRSVDNGQCVRYVQIACGAPHTSRWRPGIRVRDNEIEPGTAIACFDPDGRYGNHTDGRSHAAIFMDHDPEGLLVYDQWRGHPVAMRLIRFRGGAGRRVNDGDAFHVVEDSES